MHHSEAARLQQNPQRKRLGATPSHHAPRNNGVRDGLVAGDLVFYARGGSIYHVGLYIGDGYIIDSIPSGGVQVRTLYFCDGFCGGGSPL